MALLGDIQLAETVEPEGHKFGADLGRFGQLLIGKTGFQFFFCRLQFFKALFRGFGQNTLLDRIYQVANLGIRFLFPQFLRDENPKERQLGLFFGNALMSKCSEVWVFGEYISSGMEAEIRRAKWKNYRLRYFTTMCEEVTDYA